MAEQDGTEVPSSSCPFIIPVKAVLGLTGI